MLRHICRREEKERLLFVSNRTTEYSFCLRSSFYCRVTLLIFIQSYLVIVHLIRF